MVCGIHKLTQRECLAFIKKVVKRGIKKALLNDGGGLYLRATSTGTASWVFRYETAAAPHEHGLGAFTTFTLDEVRERSRKCRQLLADRLDPITESQKARHDARAAMPSTGRTFKYCALKFIDFKEAGWSNDKHRQDWERSLENYVFPLLGNRPVSTITLEDVLAVLSPHWGAKTETMMRVRGRIENILGWAAAQKPPLPTGSNPATWRGNLDAHLNADVRKEVKHFAALDYEEIPALVVELQAVPEGADAPDVTSDALLFTLLAAARSGETRGARWSEFNFETRTWAIPGSRMKGGVEHRVPMTETIVALLRRQPTYQGDTGGDGFVFCGPQARRALSNRAMLDRLKVLRPDVTVHGTVRSTFSTWATDVAQVQAEVREAALAHAEDVVVKAYKRSDHLPARRKLMAKWEEHCLTPWVDNVLPFSKVV
jgi:integrase